jgi:L-fuconolactonase
MRVIDSQVHVYEANHPDRPWAPITGPFPMPDSVTGKEQIDAMDRAGVDGAILVSPWALYRADPSYVTEVQNAFPDRFRMVCPVDWASPGAPEFVDGWAGRPGSVGIRLMVASDAFVATDAMVKAVVEQAVRRDLVVCVFCWGYLPVMADLARAYPEAQFVIDHLGLPQPITPPRLDTPFDDLAAVLELAGFPNVAIKVSGACTLSARPFPFDDLWGPLSRVFDAFGLERCMWGSDWTRTVDFVAYPDEVAAFREHLPLSASDRAALMGSSAERIFRWSAAAQ